MSVNDDRLIMEARALQWCERYGIIEYRVKNWILTYNVSYPAYLNNPKYTIQHTVDLKTGKELPTKRLKRFDTKGLINRN